MYTTYFLVYVYRVLKILVSVVLVPNEIVGAEGECIEGNGRFSRLGGIIDRTIINVLSLCDRIANRKSKIICK